MDWQGDTDIWHICNRTKRPFMPTALQSTTVGYERRPARPQRRTGIVRVTNGVTVLTIVDRRAQCAMQ